MTVVGLVLHLVTCVYREGDLSACVDVWREPPPSPSIDWRAQQ